MTKRWGWRIMKRIVLLFLFSILFFLTGNYGQIQASQVNFTVQPITSDYQLNKKKTYFDLKADPGTDTQLKIKVINLINRPIKVAFIVRNATTNYNGVVEYAESQSQVVAQQPFSIIDTVKLNQDKMTIPANGEKIITMDVELPKKSFNGIVAGGISVIEDSELQTQGKTRQAVIDNRYLYTTAVVFHGQKNVDSAQLNLKKVEPIQINARNVIAAKFENQSAMFLNNVHVNARVRQLGNSKIIYQSDNKDMQIAPSSEFVYPIPLIAGKSLKSGTYEFMADVTSKNQIWHFKQKFTIDGLKARELNKKDVTIDHTNYLFYWTVFILLIVVINALIIFWINRKLKKKYQEINEHKQFK